SANGTPIIDLYLADEAHHKSGIPFMPHAKLLFEDLQRDATVQPAIDNWVAALGSPTCEVGTRCKPGKVCYQGAIASCGDDFACKPTVPVPNGTTCGDQLACFNGTCAPSVVISIPMVNKGVYVRHEGPRLDQAHVHVSVGGGKLFVTQVST